ncbi:unnamed protein product [Thlaspi arvense]|uniref:Uncharacterized protein n=1 Tax=Thlaspi arvense TaxID=13288 RepID=A0AAU9S6R1_THLAR|nr:unnamed protein product [Thlaspi arvense]
MRRSNCGDNRCHALRKEENGGSGLPCIYQLIIDPESEWFLLICLSSVAIYNSFAFNVELFVLQRVGRRPRCFSGSPEKKTPAMLKWAVGGVTELLRLFSVASSPSSSIPKNKDK